MRKQTFLVGIIAGAYVALARWTVVSLSGTNIDLGANRLEAKLFKNSRDPLNLTVLSEIKHVKLIINILKSEINLNIFINAIAIDIVYIRNGMCQLRYRYTRKENALPTVIMVFDSS